MADMDFTIEDDADIDAIRTKLQQIMIWLEAMK